MKHVVWMLSLLVLLLFSFGFSAIIEKVPKAPFSANEASTWVLEEIEGKDVNTEAMLVNSYFFFKPQEEVKVIIDMQVEKANWDWNDQIVEIHPVTNNPWMQELEGTWLVKQSGRKSMELVSLNHPESKMKFKRVRP